MPDAPNHAGSAAQERGAQRLPGDGVIELTFALVLLLGCSIYAVVASQFSFGTLSSPKAGFLPIIVGWTAVLLAFLNFVQTFIARKGLRTPATSIGKAVVFCAGLAGYVVLWPAIGFLPATFLVSLFLLKVSDVRGWFVPVVISAALPGVLFVAFSYFLQISLP